MERLGINELAGGCPFVSPGQTLIRRSALQKVGGFDASIWGADDFDLYLRLASQGELRSIRHVSLFYRVHPGNASRDRERMLFNSHEVVRRHFSERSAAAQRRAFRWLYAYAGREWVLTARRLLRGGSFRAALANLGHLRCFAKAVWRDFGLAARIAMDLLPERWSSQETVKAYHLMVEIDAPAVK